LPWPAIPAPKADRGSPKVAPPLCARTGWGPRRPPLWPSPRIPEYSRPPPVGLLAAALPTSGPPEPSPRLALLARWYRPCRNGACVPQTVDGLLLLLLPPNRLLR